MQINSTEKDILGLKQYFLTVQTLKEGLSVHLSVGRSVDPLVKNAFALQPATSLLRATFAMYPASFEIMRLSLLKRVRLSFRQLSSNYKRYTI